MQSAQHKKLYENALSSGQSAQSLMKALSSVLRLAIGDHSHFSFLLYNINWFNEPYLNHISVLEKALRLYRGRGKQSQKVAYNILTDGMWSSAASQKVCECLINLIKPGFDHKLLKQSLAQNYPHKVVELQMQQNYLRSLLYLYLRLDVMRFDLLQLMILQLACFDTELCTEGPLDSIILPSDSEIRAARLKQSQNAEHSKFDALISILMQELSTLPVKDGRLFKELLLIFKNDLVLVQQTQYVQFVIYYFAEMDKKEAKNFVAFLMCEIMERIENKANRKVIAALTNYLSSYVSRSMSLTGAYITKTVANLIKLTQQILNTRNSPKNESAQSTQQQSPQFINLGRIFEDNFDILLLLQSVLWIWTKRPECRDHNYEELQNLLARCDKQIYYKYFIHHDLLKQTGIIDIGDGVSLYRCLEVVDKFTPPLLKRLSFYVGPLVKVYERQDQKLKLELVKSEVKYENIVEGLPSKRVKSEKKQSNETSS